jgi:hypothetical protein
MQIDGEWLHCDDGVVRPTVTVHVKGSDGRREPESTDRSILGRDVLDNFDLILSRRREEVLLLALNHRYQVTPL